MKKIIFKLIPILAGLVVGIAVYYQLRIITETGEIEYWYSPWYSLLLGISVYFLLKLSLPYYQEIGNSLNKILKGIWKMIKKI